MKKFKKYSPVNLTAAPAKDTEKIINQWNAGRIKLLVGHPACVHPKTKVLTKQYGWVNIIDVKQSDTVFDGTEFVSHDGCSYSGYKEVINVFGITMTPGHKILINGKWKEGQHVRNCKKSRNEAIFKWEKVVCSNSKMHELWDGITNNETERNETQQEKKHLLSTLYSGFFSPYDKYKDMEYLVGYEKSCERHVRQRLWWSWYNNVQRLGRLQNFLQGYVTGLFRQFNNRTSKCKWSLFKRKLYMGDSVQTTGEQAEQSFFKIQRENDPFGRIGENIRFQQDDVAHEIKQRNDSRRSGGKLQKLHVRKKYEKNKCQSKKKAHVYDLVNCGPRHQFLMRNSKGECFISHNSMGHGVDGLQESGSILVWFGVNWSLELYEQMIGRLDRQGQKNIVSIIRILCRDTIDLAVVDAIERKTDDQEGLKSALQRYRDGITTNALEVNFF